MYTFLPMTIKLADASPTSVKFSQRGKSQKTETVKHFLLSSAFKKKKNK